MRLLLKGGEIIDPAGAVSGAGDILMEDGLIVKIGPGIDAGGAEVYDASGLKIFPGLLDIHVHFRDPGYEYKETVESGLRAAAAGGFTSVVCMPNTKPAIDTQSVVKYLLDKAAAAGLGRLFVAGAATRGRQGETLSEIGDMMAEGIVAVTDDGSPIMNAQLTRRVLEYTKSFGIPYFSHSEDINLAGAGVMNEGLVSTTIGMRATPKAAEIVMVVREIELCALTGGRLHLTHISTRESMEAVKRARARGLNVTCDTTPHHLTLTEDLVPSFDTNLKVNPPLRSEDDRQAMIEGVADGTIDAIASDHAPHAHHEKETSFEDAPFGLIGLETTVPVLYTELVETGLLTPEQFTARLSSGPGAALGIDAGRLEPGAPADFALVETGCDGVVDSSRFFSKSRNCPFNGRKVSAKIRATICKGKFIFRDGEIVS